VVIVAGYLIVAPQARDVYLRSCVEFVEQARTAPGCLDFAISADSLDAGRINIFERWETPAAAAAFRGAGPSDAQGAMIEWASISEFGVAGERRLT
jgi:quinol monooxygenase YgiN